jgi:hypothetical protein
MQETVERLDSKSDKAISMTLLNSLQTSKAGSESGTWEKDEGKGMSKETEETEETEEAERERKENKREFLKF